MSAIRVTVVIPVKNDAERLRLCLEGMARQTLAPEDFETVVVDNGSEDDPAATAAAFPFAVVVVEETPGASAARNFGLAMSRGDAVAFIDADCIPRPDWLEAGLHRLAEFPKGGLVAGHIEVLPLSANHPSALELFDMAYAFDQKLFVERWGFGATANVFVTRAVADSVCGFDERIPYYGEDVDFCRRAAEAGWPVVYEPGAVVSHPTRRGWGSLCARLDRTIRAAYGGRDPSFRRLAIDLRYDWPRLRTIAASLFHPLAGGVIGGLKLAFMTAVVKILRAWFRIRLFREQRRRKGAS